MNIISKYKDYYDFLTGIYGVDKKIVLDRREFDKYEIREDDDKKITLYICDMVYDGFQREGKFYWGKQILELLSEDELEKYHNPKFKYKGYLDSIDITTRRSYWSTPSHETLSLNPKPSKDKVNTTRECAICISDREWNDSFYDYPILKDLNVGSILPPQEIYLMLVEWLTPKDIVIDTRTNKEKILTNGFDLKSSFRHPVK